VWFSPPFPGLRVRGLGLRVKVIGLGLRGKLGVKG